MEVTAGATREPLSTCPSRKLANASPVVAEFVGSAVSRFERDSVSTWVGDEQVQMNAPEFTANPEIL